mgnify:CR=1 FL=1
MADKLKLLELMRVIVVPLVGPSCGKLTSVPRATVAALSGGISAKKSAKPNAVPRGSGGPGRPGISGCARQSGRPSRSGISDCSRWSSRPGRSGISGCSRRSGRPCCPGCARRPLRPGSPGWPRRADDAYSRGSRRPRFAPGPYWARIPLHTRKAGQSHRARRASRPRVSLRSRWSPVTRESLKKPMGPRGPLGPGGPGGQMQFLNRRSFYPYRSTNASLRIQKFRWSKRYKPPCSILCGILPSRNKSRMTRFIK